MNDVYVKIVWNDAKHECYFWNFAVTFEIVSIFCFGSLCEIVNKSH